MGRHASAEPVDCSDPRNGKDEIGAREACPLAWSGAVTAIREQTTYPAARNVGVPDDDGVSLLVFGVCSAP